MLPPPRSLVRCSPVPRRPPRPYHHGDLARALRSEALVLVDEVGPDAVTLRELARRVGVSHAAPYRHYPDKRTLFTALAVEAIGLLGDSIRSALAAAGSDLRARFLAGAYAYVRFAVDHRAHFKVAFFSTEVETNTPEMLAARARCFGLLLAYISEAHAAGYFAAGESMDIATAVWGMHHGLAALASVGGLDELGDLRAISDAAHGRLLDGLLATQKAS